MVTDEWILAALSIDIAEQRKYEKGVVMTETVRLVLTGHLMPDVQPEDAIQQLADALNINLATATQLLHTAPTVIKQLEVGAQVDQYLQIFARIGVEVTVIPWAPAIAQKGRVEHPQPKNTNQVIAGQNDDDTDDNSDYNTPPFFAMDLQGRLGRTHYIINLMASMLPCLLAAMLLPGLMMRNPAIPGSAAGWLLMAALTPLLLWTGWQYFRCVVLRLHDLNLSAYWAGLFVLVFLLCQLVLQNYAIHSYASSLSLFLLTSLMPLVLALYPGHVDDNLFGKPAEPAEVWKNKTAFVVITLALLSLLYKTSNSHLQFVMDKARDGKILSEQNIQLIYKAHRKDISDVDLNMMIKLEEQEMGRTNIDRSEFRQQTQQRLDKALLAEIQTLQYPLQAADLPVAERRLVTESELDQYMNAIAHECGCDTTIRELARRELQRRHDDNLRSKLGLPLPE